MFGETLVTKNGVQKTTDVLSGKKAVGIYFSAHWCPPCRGFTPVLAETYSAIQTEQSDALEIIFVSSDSDDKSFRDYFSHMPWTALPYDDRELAEALAHKFGVRGIPSFFIVNGETGANIDLDGRTTVATARGDASKCIKKWVQ